MKNLMKTLLGAVAVLLVLAIGLVLYVSLGDLSVHKDRILNAASDATGFYIAAAGPFDLEVGREITLSAQDITIGNPAWSDEHPLATTGNLRVIVDTWSALSGPIEIDSLFISDAHVNLKSGEDGSANWLPARTSNEEDEPAAAGPDPVIHEIVLNDVRISHEVNGDMLFVSETSALLLTRTGLNEFDFDLDEKLDETSLKTSGTLRFADSLADVSNVSIEVNEAALSVSGATKVSASFSGTAQADVAGKKPVLVVNVELSELIVASGEDKSSAASNDEVEATLLFDTTPLSYSWLDSLDMDADIRVVSANLKGNALSDLRVVASIRDAALSLAPVEFMLGDGRFLGSLDLAPADAEYTLELSAEVDNLRLAQLADEGQDLATVPPLNAALNLTGTGASLHDIMATSNGKLSGRQESGQLNLQAMGALFSDFLTSIVRTLNPLAEERTYANVECGIFDVNIVDGVANIEEMALQSDRLTIVSSGSIDFESEALDLTLNTKSREGLGVSVGDVANSFIKLGGTLKEPSLGVDAVGSVTTTGAAVATGGLSLLAKGLWDRVSSEVDICKQ